MFGKKDKTPVEPKDKEYLKAKAAVLSENAKAGRKMTESEVVLVAADRLANPFVGLVMILAVIVVVAISLGVTLSIYPDDPTTALIITALIGGVLGIGVSSEISGTEKTHDKAIAYGNHL